MPLRRLVLLCLAACVPSDAPAPNTGAAKSAAQDGTPVPKDSPSVPKDSSPGPAPKDSQVAAALDSPRLLHGHLTSFAPLADGALLVDVRPVPTPVPGPSVPSVGLQRLASGDGALTSWSQGWRPDDVGWKLAEPYTDHANAPVVSPDGRWVALWHGFTPRTPPAPGEQDVIAAVVSRADGSEPRCVGAAILEDEAGGDPPLLWTSDSGRLLGGWSDPCEPDARGRLRSSSGGRPGTWPPSRSRPLRTFAPQDGSTGEAQDLSSFDVRDPLGDHVARRDLRPDVDGVELLDLVSGARLGSVADDPDERWIPRAWVSADTLLVDAYSRTGRKVIGHRAVTTDGAHLAAPGPGWRVYTRLPGGEVLFTRDAGVSVEQGRVDWNRFAVEASRPRPDLMRFTGDFDSPGDATWTLGLGGVLIFERRPGALHFAEI